MRGKIKNIVMLFLTSIIWGIAFVAQSEGINYVGTFTFSAVRFFLAGMVLLPIVIFSKKDSEESNKMSFKGGIIAGVSLFIACNLQQAGLIYTSVGKSGFITAMYIVFCPIISLLLGKKSYFNVWIGVSISLIGLFLLCMPTTNLAINIGDIITFASAIFFAIQILVIDHYSPKCNSVKLACTQFFTCAILSGACMLVFEKVSFNSLLVAWLPIIYSGVLSCGLGYTFQIVGQKGINPTVASLIMSLESVFAVIAAWIILNQSLSIRELCGCLFMFVAIIIVQLPAKAQKENSEVIK